MMSTYHPGAGTCSYENDSATVGDTCGNRYDGSDALGFAVALPVSSMLVTAFFTVLAVTTSRLLT